MSAKFMKNAFVGWTFTAGMYYPPDYDPSKLLPLKHLKARGETKEKLLNIRMMFPFTMICDACGEYNYTGTKFTSKLEQIKSESYLGIKVYRFYGRCTHCWSEFTFKTDPKNSDYTMESGGKRTYEAWKDADMAESELKKQKEDAEKDQMKALEQKSIDVQAEMQRIEDLDAIRTMNKRSGHRDQSIEDALEYLFKKEAEREAEKDDLVGGETEELADLMQAQEQMRREKLDAEVEGGLSAHQSAASSSSSSAPIGSAPASSSRGATPGQTASVRDGAIAAAVAERASSQSAGKAAVGARFTVKRKSQDDAEATDSSKRQCGGETMEKTEETLGTSVGSNAAGTDAAAATGSTGMGLMGAYDSDSS
jgi:hypothetical protein